MTPQENLKRLNIELPQPAPPAAAFVPYVQSGDLLFVSGHIAKKNGQSWQGRLGRDLTVADGQQAARAVAIDLIATLQQATSGDLTRIRRIVNLMVLVTSEPTFTEQHLVANGASELLGEVFGDAGRHARAAFGVAQLPLGACVEITLVAEVL